jgi:predicted nucleic acid-binding protein
VIVIADTSPVHYLLLTGVIDILPVLFSEVIVPPGVLGELQHPHAPDAVRDWAKSLPEWTVVRSPINVDPQVQLGRREAEAIALALEMQADVLLMDDRRARREAELRGLAVAGTVGVLEAAAKRQLLSLPDVIARLRQTNFHIADQILERALEDNAQRNSRT